MLGKPEARVARRGLLREPHIAPLTEFVEALRAKRKSGCDIPYFDPWDGGVVAEVLFLLEAPGSKAVQSGFVSRNNPDETAKNFFELNEKARIPRNRTIMWNIVPWYIGSSSRIHSATSDDIKAGIQPLMSLLEHLPMLRGIVLLGKKAQCSSIHIANLRPNVTIFHCPHPSPMFVNRSPLNRDKILTVLREVADCLGIYRSTTKQ